MRCYLISNKKEDCCGCRACEQVCNNACIGVIEDEEGFLYPEIDKNKCVKCNACINVCPMYNKLKVENSNHQKAYAAWTKNRNTRMSSSSGGIFTSIAEYVLVNDGVVVGSVLGKNMIVKHIIVNNLNDLEGLKGSKYVQSDTLDTYSQIKNLLKDNKLVLFTGTPCQVAGLRSYLKFYNENVDNLILIDIICHGVPSNKFFKKYVESLEQEINGRVINFKFRKKVKNDWKLSFTYEKENKILEKNIVPMLSPYYYGFQNNMIHRPSCYSCQYCTTKREGDITIGDYWGVNKFHKNLNAKNGISAVIINSDKGIRIFNNIKNSIEFTESGVDRIKAYNKNLSRPSTKHEFRKKIYIESNSMPFKKLAKKYLEPKNKLLVYFKHMIPTEIKDRLRK